MEPMTFFKHQLNFYIVILVLIACAPVRGQHAFKELTGGDYGKWGSLRLNQISDDGAWIAFTMGYAAAKDTLYIRHAAKERLYTLAGGRHGSLIANSHYIYSSPEGLNILSLEKGNTENIGPVNKFELTSRKSVLIYTAAAKGEGSVLTIRHIKSSKSYTVNGISEYSYCPGSDNLATVALDGSDYTVSVVAPSTGNQAIIYRGKGFIRGSMVWQRDGRSIAFAERDPNGGERIIACDISQRRTYILDLGNSGLIAGEISLIPQRPSYSADGKYISFYIKPVIAEKVSDTAGGPEIWHAFDKELYPARRVNRGWESVPKLAIWDLEKGTSRMLTDKVCPYIMLTQDYDYALLWNPLDIEPDHTDDSSPHYTLWNLKTNERKTFLKATDARTIYMATSPDGRFATYFDGKDWIAYEFSSGIHYNLTASLPVPFATEKDGQLTNIPFSSPGWDRKGNFIIYDNYDIWSVSPGEPARKLTDGREKGLRYRIAPIPGKEMGQTNHNGRRSLEIDMEVPLLLELSKGLSGYAVLKPEGKVSEICGSSDFYSQGAISGNGKKLLCMRQNYHTPPQLLYYSRNADETVIYASNTHYSRFGVQNAEKIIYTTKTGRQLNGMLYYPLLYDKAKKHPVIVHIYEDQGWQTNWYVNPSFSNPTGFNVSNFTGDGYFVFLPNITYGGSNPGNDAVECVEAGVKAISGRADIDREKIGLIGHSFGGYETNFIMGHSDLFAAAVSGAPINDMGSFYHYVVPGIFKPNFFNLENGQFRMPVPYFEQPLKYLEASPLFSAGNIKAPVLSWAGKEDRQIDQSQIKAFYLAMRRTGKEHIMLLYPNEGHLILSEENQYDLTLKIAQWFSHYLKGLPLPVWASPDFNK